MLGSHGEHVVGGSGDSGEIGVGTELLLSSQVIPGPCVWHCIAESQLTHVDPPDHGAKPMQVHADGAKTTVLELL